MHPSVLTNIKCIQVKAKRLNLPDKRVEPPAGQVQPSMSGQVVTPQCHIIDEMASIWIGLWMVGRVGSCFQTIQYRCYIASIDFLCGVAQRVLIDDRESRNVAIKYPLKGY